MTDLCNEIEKFGKGIGNTSRYRIIEALFQGPKTVSKLVKAVRQSQPLVSQHLRVLKSSDIVVDERRGKQILYSLNTAHVVNLLGALVKEVKQKK